MKETMGMTQERLIELINSEIDGLNSASEHQELMQHVASDEQSSRLYQDFLRTAAALKNVPQAPPPSFLKIHVMNSIHAAPGQAARQSGWLSPWTALFRAKPATRYAIVFASGLFVGLLFLVLTTPWQQRGEPDASSVSGSLALFSNLHRLPVHESVRFNGEGWEGVIKTYKSGGNVFVEIEVQSSADMKIELNCDPGDFGFAGIRRLPGAEGEVNVTQGKVVLSGVRSEQAVVALSRGNQVNGIVGALVYKGNVLVYKTELRLQ